MKRFLTLVLIIILQLSVVSCSKSESEFDKIKNSFSNYHIENSTDIEIHKAETKVFYAEKQFVSFEISSDFEVYFNDSDIILFDDKTAMVKLYSYIKIIPSNQNFKKNINGVYINLLEKTAITKINTGSKTLSIQDIDLNNFKIVNAMQITPKFETFENIGICVYLPKSQEDELNLESIKITKKDNALSSSTGTVFYAFLNENTDLNNLTKDDFESNINFSYSSNSTNNITLNFDMLFNFQNFAIFSIIKTEKDNFYYLEMKENSNGIFELENIEKSDLANFKFQIKN